MRHPIKRSAQQWLRQATGSLKRQTYVQQICHNLQPLPACFDRAQFNFTIDFELGWGNARNGDSDLSVSHRKDDFWAQKENFYPFLEMLERLQFSMSWALLGKLLAPDVSAQAPFSPTWSQSDWYAIPHAIEEARTLGPEFLEALKQCSPTQEILSHGFAHIDYQDSATTDDVAEEDLRRSVTLLGDFGLHVAGFVFPCNHVAHENLLSTHGVTMYRGQDNRWGLAGC